MPLKSWSEMMKDAETQTSGFEPLEPGSYSFVVEKPAQIRETGKGLPKFSINASVESGPRQNARIFHDFNVTESAYAMREYFFKPLYAIGLSSQFFETNPTNEQIANALQGKRFSARVEMEEGNDGVKRPRLTDFAPPSGAAPAGPQPGVPSMGAPAAPAAPAPAAPSVQKAPEAPAAPAPAAPTPAATTAPDDSNPWAAAPPPPPAF